MSQPQRVVLQTFQNYQQSRVNFVTTINELASRPSNIEALRNSGCMSLLRPLLQDNVPMVAQTAAIALGRLANFSDDLAQAVVDSDILPQLVYSLSEQNRFYKKAAAFVMRAVAKHSPEQAQAVVDSGALEGLVVCLEEFDPGVKEAAAWALGYVARHNTALAQAVLDSGAVPLLVLCIQEPEMTLKRIAASALSDICKHSPELAQAVVNSGAIAYLSPLINNSDSKLQRQVCSALAQIARHSVDLAELVVEGGIFPGVIMCLKTPQDLYVRKNAATLIREICKQTPELAQLVVNAGSTMAMVDYINNHIGSARLPSIMALGYIAAFGEALAMSVILARGVPAISAALVQESEAHIKAACAWALGQIGRHSPDHALQVAQHSVLPKLMAIYTDEQDSSSKEIDLKAKSKRTLKVVIQKVVSLEALEPLLNDAPTDILKYVIAQYAKVLPHDATARRNFVTTGGLQKIQDIVASDEKENEVLADYIQTINNCYPEEIVRYYSPGYSATILEKIDSYVPQIAA